MRCWITALAVAVVAASACGTTPADPISGEGDGDGSDGTGGTDTTPPPSDAGDDGEDDPDRRPSPPDATEECPDWVDFECLSSCSSDVPFAPLCIIGAWECPPEAPIRTTECEDLCSGAARLCCDEAGVQVGFQECDGDEWRCFGGTADACDPPIECPPIDTLGCVPACEASAIFEPECIDGEWRCPPDTVFLDECTGGCRGRPAGCCAENGSRTGPNCIDGEWTCPEGSSFEACGDRPPVPRSMVGTFAELEWVSCTAPPNRAPEDPIAELIFTAEGTYQLTFQSHLFETFIDYRGSYTYAPETGELSMMVDGGNTLFDDLDLDGRVERFPDGTVVLWEMWLGNLDPDARPPAWCGHRLERR